MLNDLILALPTVPRSHWRGSHFYNILSQAAKREIAIAFDTTLASPQPFGPFGHITFPYYRMGDVTTLDLFGLDELILFSFYWHNRERYHCALDIGANLGLHSIIMSRCGFQVCAFEPDPTHFAILKRNLAGNGPHSVLPFDVAISSNSGTLEFVRVANNTTGSHIVGAKPQPYGPTEQFHVQVQAFRDCLPSADLIKLDAEGHEAEILLSVTSDEWGRADAFVEISSKENAGRIFEHLRSMGLRMFSQKLGWGQALHVNDLPTSWKDGMLFVTRQNEMPWY